jgi:DNA mismatch repair protein MutL
MSSQRLPIRALAGELIDKIAAGEVVERPSSVVKELVENALDAGSNRVTVAIKDGGRKLIRVADDGCGIPPEELELALTRHATSKISSFDDLYRLATKGFRGEALASIASVSQLSLTSRAEGQDAREIIVHGGVLVDERAAAHPRGTTVEVKYLFYQTPARLKFLRSRETETSHVEDAVTKLALSHPRVAFTLIDDDRTIFEAPVFDDATARLTAILGKESASLLYPFSGEAGGMSVGGFFGHPQAARSQRGQAYFFVNGRAVNDKTLWHAVMESYRDLLMKGKYPVLVLNLKVDEAQLDVNVHPQKSEVRFHHPQQVHGFVYEVLRGHLKAQPWMEKNPVLAPSSASPSLQGERTEERGGGQSLKIWGDAYFAENKNPTYPSPAFAPSPKPAAQNELRFGKTPYADMRPVGQLFGTYIVCESPGKLILVDQHAAHERVGFEKLMLDFKERGIAREALVVPETFELKPSDAEILKNYLGELDGFGFEIDPFGGNTFAVKALPVIFKNKQALASLIADVIADVKAAGELVSLKDRLHHVFATMACHGQIRAHHRLTIEEMAALLKELDEYQFTDFCPHGRPVCVEITEEDIQKWFRRLL